MRRAERVSARKSAIQRAGGLSCKKVCRIFSEQISNSNESLRERERKFDVGVVVVVVGVATSFCAVLLFLRCRGQSEAQRGRERGLE